MMLAMMFMSFSLSCFTLSTEKSKGLILSCQVLREGVSHQTADGWFPVETCVSMCVCDTTVSVVSHGFQTAGTGSAL